MTLEEIIRRILEQHPLGVSSSVQDAAPAKWIGRLLSAVGGMPL